MPDENATPAPSFDIDWLKTAAGALAAVTTVVLLSTLGAVGTLIGAALGSVAATVGSALYARGLERGRRTVLRAQETAAHAVRRPRGSEPAPADLETEPAPVGRVLPWKRIALLAAGTFVVVLLAITLFEQATGRSVSSYTGGSDSNQGSTVGGVTHGGNGDTDTKHRGTTDEPTKSPSEEPTEKASETPSETPTETPSETPTETPTPTPTPTSTPTPTPTPSSTPTPTPSATPTR